ncbi:hypothetical protein [Pseudomonas sp. LRF_L74]
MSGKSAQLDELIEITRDTDCVKTTALGHAALKNSWNASPVKMLIYSS